MGNRPCKRRRSEAQENDGEVTEVSRPLKSIRQPASLCTKLGTHVTFLFVGLVGQPVTIHTSLLPEQTRAHLNRMLATQHFYYFPNDSLRTAQMYQQFLYTERISCIDEADAVAPATADDIVETTEYTVLAHGYLFGQELEDERFSNACIDALIEKVIHEETFPTGLAAEIWPFTRGDDRLRRLIVDFHVLMGKCTCIQPPHDDSTGPAEFLEQVYGRESRVSRPSRQRIQQEIYPWQNQKCWSYHSHRLTARCLDFSSTTLHTKVAPHVTKRPSEVSSMSVSGARRPSLDRHARAGTSLPSPLLSPQTATAASSGSRNAKKARYTWGEEAALLQQWDGDIERHNAWLSSNGYSFQRRRNGVQRHMTNLLEQGADIVTIMHEQKTWQQIQRQQAKGQAVQSRCMEWSPQPDL